MNLKKIRMQNVEELKSTLLLLKKDFVKISCKLNSGNTETSKKLRAIRKDIARIYTVFKEKEGI